MLKERWGRGGITMGVVRYFKSEMPLECKWACKRHNTHQPRRLRKNILPFLFA